MTFGNFINGKPVFDPAEFGLSDRFNTKSQLGSSDKCYVRNYDSEKSSMVLRINGNTGRKIIEALGNRINFDFDKNGSIFVWSGNARKLSKSQKGDSYTISMDVAKSEYVRLVGTFKRLYLSPEFHGTHVEFKQTGERD